MITALLVGVYGVAGALLRFAVDSWIAHRPGPRPHWPRATLSVKVAGSIIIGVSLGGPAPAQSHGRIAGAGRRGHRVP